MKTLLEDYQRRYATVNSMIAIEKDPDTLIRLKTKSISYREFINEIENTIKRIKVIEVTTKMDMFIESLESENWTKHMKEGSFPYIGNLTGVKDITPIIIINKIHEAGYLSGIETGKYQKTLEIKRVLDINISND